MLRILLILFLLISTASAEESRINAALLISAKKALSEVITENELVGVLESGLWNPERSALAVSVLKPKASVLYVFLLQANDTYLAIDISGVESGNFGKLGRSRSDYERFETTPTEWLHRTDGLFSVHMRTRAWRDGKRYTVYEPLIICPDGSVLYR